MIVIKRINIGVILLLASLLSLIDAKTEILQRLNRISRQVNIDQSNNFGNNFGNTPQRRPWSPNQGNNNNNQDLITGNFVGFTPLDLPQNNNNIRPNQSNRPTGITVGNENTDNSRPNLSNRPTGITVGNENNQGSDLVFGTFVGFTQADIKQNQQITVGASTTRQPARFATTQSPEYYQCLRMCPQTSEYNPICGSDDQNYHNLSRLNCSQRCGINVSMVKIGACNPL